MQPPHLEDVRRVRGTTRNRPRPYPRKALRPVVVASETSVMSPVRPSAFGGLLRHFRGRCGLSQLALASRVETTTRHLSYVENGRSRPGRDMVLRLAEALDLPL